MLRIRRRPEAPPPWNPVQSLPGPRRLSASRRDALSKTYCPGESSLEERRKKREARQLHAAKNLLEYPATSLSHHARRAGVKK